MSKLNIKARTNPITCTLKLDTQSIERLTIYVFATLRFSILIVKNSRLGRIHNTVQAPCSFLWDITAQWWRTSVLCIQDRFCHHAR